MVRMLRRSLVLLSLLAIAGCSSVEMSLSERPGSDASVVLTGDTQVFVTRPTLSDSAAATLDDEHHPRGKYTSSVRRAMIDALERRGVAVATTAEEAESTLRIRITGFGRGGGAAGFFFRGGIEYSTLDGSAVLETPSGHRELVIEQAGAQAEETDAEDQTSRNIEAFTNAIAERISPRRS